MTIHWKAVEQYITLSFNATLSGLKGLMDNNAYCRQWLLIIFFINSNKRNVLHSYSSRILKKNGKHQHLLYDTKLQSHLIEISQECIYNLSFQIELPGKDFFKNKYVLQPLSLHTAHFKYCSMFYFFYCGMESCAIVDSDSMVQ